MPEVRLRQVIAHINNGSINTVANRQLHRRIFICAQADRHFFAVLKELGADNGLAGTDVAIRVRLLGQNATDDDWHELTVDQLETGTYVSWNTVVYEDDDNKTLTLDVDYLLGAGVKVAAFFLDNVQDAGMAPIPEPATVGLMMFGLAGIFVRRKKR